ncbi:hypothetical protein ACO2Q7_17210 [Rathayibacter sp. KR2-224]|uniref:hypothetical protein n=1 Tax=Rathayibacter sp. KR2-224 TaxID=3400913 RepID=UPI003BFB947C
MLPTKTRSATTAEPVNVEREAGGEGQHWLKALGLNTEDLVNPAKATGSTYAVVNVLNRIGAPLWRSQASRPGCGFESALGCKSAGLGIDARAGGGDFAEIIKRYLVKGRNQIDTTARQIRNRSAGFEHIPSDRSIVGLVVTSEPFHFANARFEEFGPASQTPSLLVSARELEHFTSYDPDEAIVRSLKCLTTKSGAPGTSNRLSKGNPPRGTQSPFAPGDASAPSLSRPNMHRLAPVLE